MVNLSIGFDFSPDFDWSTEKKALGPPSYCDFFTKSRLLHLGAYPIKPPPLPDIDFNIKRNLLSIH